MCDLLLSVSSAFVQETAVQPEEDARLRSEMDCLLAMWKSGDLEPLVAFNQKIKEQQKCHDPTA